jgi:hypothetical protein
LTKNFPIHVVCKWLGNSALVAQKHYLQVTEEHFALALEPSAVALQNPVQSQAARKGTGWQDYQNNLDVCEKIPEDTTCGNSLQDAGIPLPGDFVDTDTNAVFCGFHPICVSVSGKCLTDLSL